MALDWGKDRSSSGAKSNGSSALPSKTTINLVSINDDKENNPAYVAAVGVVLAILIVLFTKFCVLDPLGAVNAKQSELSRAQQELANTNTMLADYDSVLSEYQSYVGANADGSSTNDALLVINTLYDAVGSQARITGISYADQRVTVNLDDTTLGGVGDIANRLREQSIVSDVTVTTAGTGSSSNSDAGFSAAVNVTLVGGEGE